VGLKCFLWRYMAWVSRVYIISILVSTFIRYPCLFHWASHRVQFLWIFVEILVSSLRQVLDEIVYLPTFLLLKRWVYHLILILINWIRLHLISAIRRGPFRLWKLTIKILILHFVVSTIERAWANDSYRLVALDRIFSVVCGACLRQYRSSL